MNERIEKLTCEVLAGNAYPAIVPTEYDRTDIFLTEHEKNGKRIYEYVTNQEPVIFEFSAMTGLLIFDGTVPGDAMSVSGLVNIKDALSKFYRKPIENLSTFEWQHATANYAKIIKNGINGIIAEIEESKKKFDGDTEKLGFLDALKRCAEALIVWARKCSVRALEASERTENPEYRKNLVRLSEALLRVPARPAESFYEAVLTIYICFCYDPDSLGTLDRTLKDFYFGDIEKGILTRDEAKALLQELYLMLQSKTSAKSDRFTRGGESHFCVGGYLPDRTDGFSDLSLLMLEALCELPTFIPQISLRWTPDLPYETFKRVLDMERNDPHKRIAFINDVVKIGGPMERGGFSYEDACSYSSVGCNEVAFPGGFVGGTTNANGLRSIQNTFFDRTEDVLACADFEEFYKLYTEEFTRDFKRMIEIDNAFNIVRSRDTSYVTSLFFTDCISKALPLSKGACTLARAGCGVVGLTNVIDSLIVVKQFVYDEKLFTMQTLCDALKSNWHGYEEIHSLIKKKAHFFGNDDELSNGIAIRFFDTVHEITKDMRNVWGYGIGIGNLQGYNEHHKLFGSGTRATPDGRYDGEMLKFGIGQSDGNDRGGVTALLASVAKCDRHKVMCGSSVTNVYLEDSLIRDDDNFDKTARMLEAYFRMGGSHFQLNYVSREDLKKAKDEPQRYKSLRVRVSGYSDFFVNLAEPIQDDIIKRTVHSK